MSRVFCALLGVISASLLLVLRVCARDSGPLASHSADTDVYALIRQLTLEEKLALVHGARDPNGLGQAGYWPGVPRLGIPRRCVSPMGRRGST